MQDKFLNASGLGHVWEKIKDKIIEYVQGSTAQEHTTMHVVYEDGTEEDIDIAAWE